MNVRLVVISGGLVFVFGGFVGFKICDGLKPQKKIEEKTMSENQEKIEHTQNEIKRIEQKIEIGITNVNKAADDTKKAIKELNSVKLEEDQKPAAETPQAIERQALLNVIEKQNIEIQTLRIQVLDLTTARDKWRDMAVLQAQKSATYRMAFESLQKERDRISLRAGALTFSVGFGAGVLAGVWASK